MIYHGGQLPFHTGPRWFGNKIKKTIIEKLHFVLTKVISE